MMRLGYLVMIAGVCSIAGPAVSSSQEPACTTAAVVSKVMFSVTSDDTTLVGPRLPVRVLLPFENDLSATLDSSALWILNLPDPARADSVQIQPRLVGFRATVTTPKRAEVRGNSCVVRLGYRLTRVWRVEVTSKPDSLKVEQRASQSGANAQTRYTRFESELPWRDPLTIRVFLKDDQVFEETFERPLLNAPPLVRTSHQIADKICQLRKCGNVWVRALQGDLVKKSVEQLSIRLLPP